MITTRRTNVDLYQLVYLLAIGAKTTCLDVERIAFRFWILGKTQRVSFERSEEEMKPLLEATFAFGSDQREDEVGFLGFERTEFYPLLGKIPVMEISRISRDESIRPMLYGTLARAKFAFLMGSGVRSVPEVRAAMKWRASESSQVEPVFPYKEIHF
jgi:hypothetical protein